MKGQNSPWVDQHCTSCALNIVITVMPCPLRSRCTAWQVRGALCNLAAAAHTPCDVVPLTSPPPVSALLSAAFLPQTQVSYPATLPYSKANQLHTSWKNPFLSCHLELPTLQKAETQIPAEKRSSSSWLRTFPRGAEPAAWWTWPFRLSHASGNSRGLLSSLLLSSPPARPPHRWCAQLLRQLVPPTPSQQLWA